MAIGLFLFRTTFLWMTAFMGIRAPRPAEISDPQRAA
jgi:hypothetical protein